MEGWGAMEANNIESAVSIAYRAMMMQGGSTWRWESTNGAAGVGFPCKLENMKLDGAWVNTSRKSNFINKICIEKKTD
jgi:hypothetical protein